MKHGIFDIIGPIMVGPSSSHTAGALRLAGVARNLLTEMPERAVVTLYGSFSDTYKGHGTDRAVVAGLLGFAPDDTRIPESFQYAEKEQFQVEFIPSSESTEHPNTMKIELFGKTKRLIMIGKSVGGGNIVVTKINDYEVEFTGKMNTIIVMQDDVPGVLAGITGLMSENSVNIATMRVFRSSRGGRAATFMEIDQMASDSTMEELKKLPHIRFALELEALST